MEVLEGWAPYLSKALLHEALKAVRKVKNKFDRIDALAVLAAYLPAKLKEEVQQEIEQTIRMADDESDRAIFLVRLASCTRGKKQTAICQQALNAVRKISNPLGRATALTQLIPFLSRDSQEMALWETFQAIREGEPASRYTWIADLAPYIPDSLLQEALEIVTAPIPDYLLAKDFFSRASLREISDHQSLEALAPHLKEFHFRDVLQSIKGSDYGQREARFLAEIAPYLSSSLLQEALEITQDVDDHTTRTTTAAYLISHLPEEQQKQALPSIRTVNYRFPPDPQRPLYSQLPSEIRNVVTRETLRAALTIKDKVTQVKTLATIVPHLPKEIQEETWRMTVRKAWTIKSYEERLPLLKVLFPLVSSDSLRNEILQTARKIAAKAERAETLTTLLPFLPEDQREQIVHDIMQSIQSLDLHPYPRTREKIQARILAALASHLPEALKEEALRISHSFESELFKVLTWSALAPFLSEKFGTEIWQEALELARSIESDSLRAGALTIILPHLAEPARSAVLSEALQAAREIESDFQRSVTLTLLSPYLTQLSPTKLYPLWSHTLHFLAGRIRSALVADLRTLWPAIEVLGGPRATAETAREIYEIGDWW